MSVVDKLQIFLITYNRKKYLERTFKQIFSDESPIRDFDITILNNCSNDGTDELIKEYQLRFPNIKHIVHNHNIGGNANIVRAFEMATKDYVWVLCDDDFYNWKNWHLIEAEISKNTDVIVLSNEMVNKGQNIGDILLQLQFLPGAIYNTSLINFTSLANAYSLIQNYFPHLAFPIYAYMNNKNVFVLDTEQIVVPSAYEQLRNPDNDMADMSYTRDLEEENILPLIQYSNWFLNFINSVALLRDSKLVDDCLNSVIENEKKHNIYYQNISRIVNSILVITQTHETGMLAFWDFFYRVGLKNKFISLWCLFWFYVFNTYSTNDGYVNIIVFRKLKLRLKCCFIRINKG